MIILLGLSLTQGIKCRIQCFRVEVVLDSGRFRNLKGLGAGKMLGCHAHFQSRWKSELNISKQL